MIVRTIEWSPSDARQTLADAEWLVTNGLGGYASGTVSAAQTRRYHGVLVAALAAPFGRTMMLAGVWERVARQGAGVSSLVEAVRTDEGVELDGTRRLVAFRLENGLPVWTYDVEGASIEKRLLMPHLQNTTCVSYRLLHGDPVRLELQPAVGFRFHDAPVDQVADGPYELRTIGDRFEIVAGNDLPPLRLIAFGEDKAFTVVPERVDNLLYRVERNRGYDFRGRLWKPGFFSLRLTRESTATLLASTEAWETIDALAPADLATAEHERRQHLLAAAAVPGSGLAPELVLAADQFIIAPVGRVEDAARARAAGDEARTVIAGYHWFNDWGRDTMISLEGLTLCTGRRREAGYILRTFGHYVFDGLIPNMFPEGTKEGLYHTADATLWFFHALNRYVRSTGDRTTLRLLLPTLRSIFDRHVNGTLFGIGVDPGDGLLRQGQEGYQLTWMDAKVDDWVVTPRRGKAVEINALWFNALALLATWLREEGDDAGEVEAASQRARASFNDRFWYDAGGYLFDVVDGEQGDDPTCRPNQILAIALDHPVLDRARWPAVFHTVRDRLATPVGLRSLDPRNPAYEARYCGDLRSRDAAYHQGTVWAWLGGPYVDAWLRVHPEARAEARAYVDGFGTHLAEAGIGTLSEIFDAEPPFTPRGCIAQAWSVAEVLRAWVATAGE